MLDATPETRATTPQLSWGDWNATRPPFRSWDRCLELRRAETPFGAYLLLRRYAPSRGAGTELDGKWFVERPAAGPLGPFDDDLQAARAAQADFAKRVGQVRGDDLDLDRLRAENAQLSEENARLGLAFNHEINSQKGFVPAGFEDFYETEKTDE